MFTFIEKGNTKEENYKILLNTTSFYIYIDDNLITNLSNLCSLINYFLDEVNWVGFYLYDGKELYLGSFQGLPACTKISIGSGACGVSALKRKTIIVENVNEFKGHIACDSNTLSEIVIPIIHKNTLIGVLDIDSPILNRFDTIDQIYLEKVINKFIDIL